MIFGDPTCFAAEGDFTAQSGTFVYGRFRVWVAGCAVGTFAEQVLDLVGTTGVLRRPVPPASRSAAALGGQEFLEKVWSVVYDTGPWNAREHREWSPYVWFDSCEGFEPVRSVIADMGDWHRVVWQLAGEMQAREFRVPLATYEGVTTDFLRWLDSGLRERRQAGGA